MLLSFHWVSNYSYLKLLSLKHCFKKICMFGPLISCLKMMIFFDVQIGKDSGILSRVLLVFSSVEFPKKVSFHK